MITIGKRRKKRNAKTKNYKIFKIGFEADFEALEFTVAIRKREGRNLEREWDINSILITFLRRKKVMLGK